MNKNKKSNNSSYPVSLRSSGYGLSPENMGTASSAAAGSGFRQVTPGFGQETPMAAWHVTPTPGFGQEAPGFGQEALSGWHTTPAAVVENVKNENMTGWKNVTQGWDSYLLKPNGTKVTNDRLIKKFKNKRDAEDQPTIDRFKALLPTPPSNDDLFGSLTFNVLLKNGKRVPIDTICEEIERDPENTLIRSAEDRLIVIVEALKAGTLYWRQAFYLSTGQSSRMGGTWLPFSGIHQGDGYGETVSQIFEKDEYTSDVNAQRYPMTPRTPLDQKLKQLFISVFGGSFVPEGSGLTRFGPRSYYFASYLLGGNEFEKDGFQDTYPSRYIETPSPLKACFKNPKKFPMVKANALNAYIHEYQALPIYNLFRHLGASPIGIQNIAKNSVPLSEVMFGWNGSKKTINYKLPDKYLYGDLRNYLRKLYIDHLLGKISDPELVALVQETSLPKILEYIGKSPELNTTPKKLLSIAGMENVYGGRRKTQKKKSKHSKKSRKHRS